jgi:Domain of unknown function (DUF3846)
MATILHYDGRIEEIQPANGHDFQLAEMKKIVGEGTPQGEGWIEIIPTRDRRIMVLNEEGKLLGLPRNEQATALCDFPSPETIKETLAQYPDVIFVGEIDQVGYIVGTVLVCESREVQ